MVLFLKNNTKAETWGFFSKNSNSANESLKIKVANRPNPFLLYRSSRILFNTSGHMMGLLLGQRLEVSRPHHPNHRETHMLLHILMLRTFSNIYIFAAALCLVSQLCRTLCNPMYYSPPGSSVHGDSPGRNTGVGCCAVLQGIFPT